MGRRALAAVGLALLLAGAGCTDALLAGSRYERGGRLGVEDGYRWDADLQVTAADGLDADERRAVVARAMARVERIRGLEFRRRVPVAVVDRATYRASRDDGDDPRVDRWREQVWEALFLIGEDRRVDAVVDDVYGTRVTGYYAPGEDEIVVVSDAPTPRIDRSTLAHELVHALQDQHHSLGGSPATLDGRLATDGLVEGDAVAVQRAYERRCGSTWDCLPRPPGPAGGTGPVDRGVLLTVFAPYAAGPEFVGALRDRGGWDAVDAAYGRFPASTEQVLHPARYPDERPVAVRVPDRSAAGWHRFDRDPVAETVGEAAIYAMFRTAGRAAGDDRFSYTDPLSAGWGGDALVPYRSDGAYGYVWRTEWDSVGDARAFLAGYRDVLRHHGATRVEPGVYVVEEGPYADAFRVTRRGDAVLVVNAPSREALASVHAPR